MKILLIKIMKIALRILYLPMKLLPVKRKITYLSRQSNEKSLDVSLLSEEITQQDPTILQVFRFQMMEKGMAGAVRYLFSLLGDLYHIATSQVVICDTYSIPVSCLNHRKGLQIIQIWHAMGAIKKFGLQSLGKKEGRDESISRALQMHEHYSFVTAPSKATGVFYQEAFGVNATQIVELSLPRIDYLLHSPDRKEQFLKENPSLQGKEIVLYLPTFRDGEEEIVESLRIAFETDEKRALVISLHPLSKVPNQGYYGVNGDYNTFDLIRYADRVVTDYSACAFETAVAGKPLYFYLPDWEKYRENRGLNVDLAAEMPSCVFEDATALKDAMETKPYDNVLLQAFREKYVSQTEDCTKSMAAFVCACLDR